MFRFSIARAPCLAVVAVSAVVAVLTLLATPISLQAQVFKTNLPELGDIAATDLSPADELKMGRKIMLEIVPDPDYIDDVVVAHYLNQLGLSLTQAWQRAPYAHSELPPIQLFAVRDGSMNAFALPGGFIGVHSGLVLAVQNESELASVLAHEIGHVAQRHIARMIGREKDDLIVMVGSMLLAALAARSSPDAAQAAAMGGQALALANQLAFSRDAEREADRVGLTILDESNFDTRGMTVMFRRLQNNNKFNEGKAPAYLRTHPMSSERIADIGERLRASAPKAAIDSPEFAIIRARLRVLQDTSTEGLKQTQKWFTSQGDSAAKFYGLAFSALRLGDFLAAQAELKRALKFCQQIEICKFLTLELAVAEKNSGAALDALSALSTLDTLKPQAGSSPSMAFIWYKFQTLMLAKNYRAAVDVAQTAALRQTQDARWKKMEAQAHQALGRDSRSHTALAQSYYLQGAHGAALEQLALARKARDADHIDLSIIDVLERQWKLEVREKNKKK
jgi:predicted Zn-dependent protease